MDPILKDLPAEFIHRLGKKNIDLPQRNTSHPLVGPVELIPICKRCTIQVKIKMLATSYFQFFRFISSKVWIDSTGYIYHSGTGSNLPLDLGGAHFRAPYESDWKAYSDYGSRDTDSTFQIGLESSFTNQAGETRPIQFFRINGAVFEGGTVVRIMCTTRREDVPPDFGAECLLVAFVEDRDETFNNGSPGQLSNNLPDELQRQLGKYWRSEPTSEIPFDGGGVLQMPLLLTFGLPIDIHFSTKIIRGPTYRHMLRIFKAPGRFDKQSVGHIWIEPDNRNWINLPLDQSGQFGPGPWQSPWRKVENAGMEVARYGLQGWWYGHGDHGLHRWYRRYTDIHECGRVAKIDSGIGNHIADAESLFVAISKATGNSRCY
jgi:hypothetical protein